MKHIYLAAALSLAQPLAALAAEPPPKKMYPGFHEYYWRLFSCHGQPYFQCDHTPPHLHERLQLRVRFRWR